MTMQEIDVLHLPGNSVEMMGIAFFKRNAGKTAGCVSLSVSRQNAENHVASAASLQPRLGLLQENSMALCKYASTREQEMHSWENAYRSTREHFWRTIMHSQQNHIGISTNHFCILGYVQFRINSLVGCTYASEMM